MAKKTRQARPTTRPTVTPAPANGTSEPRPTRPVVAHASPRTAAPALRSMNKADITALFSQEYHYVVNDLRRVGILALVMFAGLIGLSFFLA